MTQQTTGGHALSLLQLARGKDAGQELVWGSSLDGGLFNRQGTLDWSETDYAGRIGKGLAPMAIFHMGATVMAKVRLGITGLDRGTVV